MLRQLISRQRAVSILRREMPDVRLKSVREMGPYLLQSGAKLGFSELDESFVVSGYKSDGGDVLPYVQS